MFDWNKNEIHNIQWSPKGYFQHQGGPKVFLQLPLNSRRWLSIQFAHDSEIDKKTGSMKTYHLKGQLGGYNIRRLATLQNEVSNLFQEMVLLVRQRTPNNGSIRGLAEIPTPINTTTWSASRSMVNILNGLNALWRQITQQPNASGSCHFCQQRALVQRKACHIFIIMYYYCYTAAFKEGWCWVQRDVTQAGYSIQ